VFDLAVKAEEAGAVDLDVGAVAHEAEFDGEPEEPGKGAGDGFEGVEALMGAAREWETMLMTRSGRDSRLRGASFLDPSRRVVGEKTRTDGLAPKALKKEKGARLGTPAGERVETQALGRGVTREVRRR